MADLERPAAQGICCMQEVPKQVHSKVWHCTPCCLSLQIYQHPATHINFIKASSINQPCPVP